MKGQVLDFSIQTNSGVISGDDGQRYVFQGTEWKADVQPARGLYVDFDVQGSNAVGIYRALGKKGSVSGSKSKATATLLALFLGGFGAHKFYMGSWGWGIIYLLTFWIYIPFIMGIVEGVRYILMTDEEFYEKLEHFQGKEGKPKPFGFFW